MPPSFSPAKGGPVPRLGSAIDRNAPSPNGRRDPSTPSRIVRSTRTPPTASQMTQLPPLELSRSPDMMLLQHQPPQVQSPGPLVPRDVDEEVVDEVVTTASMYEQSANRPRKDKTAPQQHQQHHHQQLRDTLEEEFESTDDEDLLEEDVEGAAIHTNKANAGVLTPTCTPVGGASQQPRSTRRSPSHAGDVPMASVSPVQASLAAAAIGPSTSVQPLEVRRSNSRRPPFNLHVEKKERIGRGSFGDVFRAIDLDSGNEIAVKEIVVAQDWSKDLEKQIHVLEREIRVMQKLDHPNTVKYLGAKRINDTLNIYMEYVSGGTVASQLRVRGHFDEGETRRYTQQLLEGLDYLHGKRIAHRDLKGDNLFLTKDNMIKVGDFGTSKELQTLRVTDSVAGTPNFMAPEVINCSGHSFQADVWSVGCCVVQMLTGKPPFSSMDNHMAVMFAVMKGQIESQIPTGISEALSAFLRQCFQTNPKDRATTKELLQHSWIVGDAAPQAPQPQPPSEPRVSPARRLSGQGAPSEKASDASNGNGGGAGAQHRAHHPPVIMQRHSATQSRVVSAGSSTAAATPSSSEGTTSSRSPPPSAGSRPTSTSNGKSSFVARFPRHGGPLDGSQPVVTPPHEGQQATPTVGATRGPHPTASIANASGNRSGGRKPKNAAQLIRK